MVLKKRHVIKKHAVVSSDIFHFSRTLFYLYLVQMRARQLAAFVVTQLHNYNIFLNVGYYEAIFS